MNLLKNIAGFAARLLPLAGYGLLLVACLCMGLEVRAATYTKADTTSMNLTADWAGGIVPGAGDIGLFDANLSAIKAGNLTLGANLNFSGLLFTNSLNGPVTIGSAKWADADAGQHCHFFFHDLQYARHFGHADENHQRQLDVHR